MYSKSIIKCINRKESVKVKTFTNKYNKRIDILIDRNQICIDSDLNWIKLNKNNLRSLPYGIFPD